MLSAFESSESELFTYEVITDEAGGDCFDRKITKVGGWEHNLENNEYYHTEEMYRIREIDPNVPLTLENY